MYISGLCSRGQWYCGTDRKGYRTQWIVWCHRGGERLCRGYCSWWKSRSHSVRMDGEQYYWWVSVTFLSVLMLIFWNLMTCMFTNWSWLYCFNSWLHSSVYLQPSTSSTSAKEAFCSVAGTLFFRSCSYAYFDCLELPIYVGLLGLGLVVFLWPPYVPTEEMLTVVEVLDVGGCKYTLLWLHVHLFFYYS